MLPLQGVQNRSLVRKLGSIILPCGQKNRVRERDWCMSSAFELMVNQCDGGSHFTIHTNSKIPHCTLYSFFVNYTSLKLEKIQIVSSKYVFYSKMLISFFYYSCCPLFSKLPLATYTDICRKKIPVVK